MTGSGPRAARELGRFYLPSGLEDELRLGVEDQRHLVRVLRARPGDGLEGIDGHGGSRSLRVASVDRRSLVVEAVGPLRRQPPPGAPGSPLPAVALAVAPPRPGRIEPLIDRLTQLGAARVGLLQCRHTGPEERRRRPQRLLRITREAAKQSGTAWLPELEGPLSLADGLEAGGAVVALEPGAEASLLDVLLELGPEPAARAEPPSATLRPDPALTLVVGPEGGFAPEERRLLEQRGARPARLVPSVLRIETAAELAVGIAVLIGSRRGC